MKLLGVLSLFFAAAAAGAQPVLLRDVNTTESPAGATVTPVAANGSSLFFIANRRDTGAELWRSDGTAAGTTLLRDVAPGDPSSSPRILGRIGETLFFAASDSDHGTELWRTDGTRAGTRLVADINPGPADSVSRSAVAFHDRLLFTNFDQTAVWSSDGTKSGTALVANVKAARSFQQSGDRVLFGSSEGLWITDGTPAGTKRAGSRSDYSADFVAVAGGRVFFAGSVSSDYQMLWSTDLKSEPALLKRITFDGYSRGIEAPIVPLGNRVVFGGREGSRFEPWVSDGTAAGTQRLRDVYPGTNGSMDLGEMVPLNGAAYFVADDVVHGRELWRTDGTPEGTQLVQDIAPGAAAAFDSNAHIWAALGRIWMTVSAGGQKELWTSDGSEAGTRRVAGIAGKNFVELGGRVYFEGGPVAGHTSLWSSDGTEAGTQLVADVDVPPSSYPSSLVAFGNHLVFATAAGSGWVTDGTPAGTLQLSTPSYLSIPTAYRGSLYFAYQASLYVSGGTTTAATLVKTFPNWITSLFARGGALFIRADVNYVSDGTAAGTVKIDALPPVNAADVAGHLVYLYGSVLRDQVPGQASRTVKLLPSGNESTAVFDFSGIQGFARSTYPPGGVEVWRSDGSPDGTLLVTAIPGAKLRMLADKSTIAAAAGTVFYFALDDGVHGFELWRSDLTASGTFRLPGTSLPRDLIALDDRLLFTAEDESFARSLCVTDGTLEGTHALREVAGTISGLAAANGIALFSMDDGVHGEELWQSNGTATGTFLVADVEAGAESSAPRNLTASANALFFSARTTAVGREMWALPLTWQGISIDDVRVTRAASSATLTVSLSGPANQPVTAAWATGDGSASGRLAFEPGETQKRIVVPLAPNDDAGGPRRLTVRLGGVRGAVPVKSLGAILVEQRAAADLTAEIVAGGPTANTDRLLLIRNLGPSTAADVRVAVNSYSSSPYNSNTPYETSAGEIKAGASATVPIGRAERYAATVRSAEGDPNPGDNSASLSMDSGSFGLALSMQPAAIGAGARATLLVSHRGKPAGDKVIALISSNPAVIAVPQSVTVNETTPASIDIVASSAGTARIVAAGGYDVAILTINVSPADERLRWLSHLAVQTDYNGRWTVRVVDRAADGGPATGSVALAEGGRTLGVKQLDAGQAVVPLPSLPIGQHEITATYGGDVNFYPSSQSVAFTVERMWIESFTSAVRRIDDITAELRIAVNGLEGIVPTGRLSVASNSIAIVNAPLVNGSIVATVRLAPSVRSVTVSYSGDKNYVFTSAVITLTPARERAVR